MITFQSATTCKVNLQTNETFYKQTYTDRNKERCIPKLTGTDRNRLQWRETDRNGRKWTETDRHKLKWT